MIRLAIRVRAADAELVLAELLELAPSGVEEVQQPDDVIEYAVYGPPGELPALPDLRVAAGGALVEISTQEMADDWAERWREFHRPVRIGRRMTVRPPWEPPSTSSIDLVIDPGQAFGTGAHATTRLCLELMLELEPRGAFLDLGCGSGVLAIAAAALGFRPVLALDSDPLSVEATIQNAERNGVDIAARGFDLRGPEAPPPTPTGVANLLRPLLLILAQHLARQADRAAPHRLIASGLLVSEADELAAAFAAAGLRERARREHGDWAALLLTRAPA